MTAVTLNEVPQGELKSDPGIVTSLVWIVAMVAFQFAGVMAVVVGQIAAGELTDPTMIRPLPLIGGVLLGSLGLIAVRWGYLVHHLRPAWTRTSIYHLNWKSFAATVALVVATAVFSKFYESVILGGRQMQPELVLLTSTMKDGILGIVIVYLMAGVAAPVLEELLFRGQLQGAIQAKLGSYPRAPFVAIAITSAIFAIVHMQPLAIPPLFLAGCAFGWIRWRSGSLALPIAAHVMLNVFGVTAMLLTEL